MSDAHDACDPILTECQHGIPLDEPCPDCEEFLRWYRSQRPDAPLEGMRITGMTVRKVS